MDAEYTLIYTDIVDSTAVNSRLGDAQMAAVWAAHDRQSRDLLLAWRGREVDRSDGFMALFAASADAAAFAAAYHAMLAALPVPLQARAGLHRGPLALRENSAADVALGAKPVEVVGIAKAMSARLMALARGGQTLASPPAAAELAALGWRCHSHGHWRFKGLDAPTEVFEIGSAHTAFVPPPDAEKAQRVVQLGGQWVSGEQVPHNLPAERDSFIGRLADLHTLGQRLQGGARLVTLLGPGGMGKTRLALRYGWAWRGSYPGGLWFCDLAQARGLDGLLQAAASGLDVPLGGGDPAAQLGRAIAGRGRCLVILDNFEQVIPHAQDTLGRWLDAAPLAQFIATSRGVLALPGESTLALAALPVPDAVQLFHARAQAAHAAYDPAAVDPTTVQALVDLLDGLPLAIELAAPRVRVLPPHQLLARMDDRFRLLASAAGRPDRQATLRATLQWSWELLAPHEKAALAQMSVFDGGFGWPAAEAVLDLAAVEPAPWLVDVVQGLVDKSLLRALPDARFGLLRSVQEFAADQLAADAAFAGSGPALAGRMRQRHRRYFATLDEAAATAHKCIELDNLVLACRHAVADGDAADATACLGLAWAALRLTGPFRVAVGLAQEVRQMASWNPGHQSAADFVSGCALMATGAHDEARATLTRGVESLQRVVNDVLAARLHCALGESLAASGQPEAAESSLQRAHDYAQTAGHPATLCWVFNIRGTLARARGDLALSAREFEAALNVAVAAGDLRWEGGAQGNLAALHYGAGRLDDALTAYTRALSLTQQMGDRRWAGNSQCNLGLVLLDRGQAQLAQAQFQSALSIAQSIGHRSLELTVLCNLGVSLQRQDRLSDACALLTAAVDGAHSLANHHMEVEFRLCLGSAWAQFGRWDEARRCHEAALQILDSQMLDPALRVRTFCQMAQTETAAGNADGSAQALAVGHAGLALCSPSAVAALSKQLDVVARLPKDPAGI